MKRIQKYYDDQGIRLVFNTLGANSTLRSAYINQFSNLVELSSTKQSHHVKLDCYQRLYDIKPRIKLTGFEEIDDLDRIFRTKLVKTGIDWPDAELFTEFDISGTGSDYRSELVQFVKSIKNPLLYLSGGADSEIVALAMMEAGINFQVVIFNWINKEGKILNGNDTKYAIDFCNQRNIKPIIKTIDLETLWTSNEFLMLARELMLNSPQLTTHAYMIKIMSEECPDVTHMFGGEVRFEYQKYEYGYHNISYLYKSFNLAMPNQDYIFSATQVSLSYPFTVGGSRTINAGSTPSLFYGSMADYIVTAVPPPTFNSQFNWNNNLPPSLYPYQFNVTYVIDATNTTSPLPSGWESSVYGPFYQSALITIPQYPTANQGVFLHGINSPSTTATLGTVTLSYFVNVFITGGTVGGVSPYITGSAPYYTPPSTTIGGQYRASTALAVSP